MIYICKILFNVYFFTRNSQQFEKEYKITVVDMAQITNILKIQVIPLRNKGVFAFSIKCTHAQ